MTAITITFDVEGVDPTLVDPLEIAEALIDAYTEDRRHRADVLYFEPAENRLEAEWEAEAR
jgi:hypothetical protein